MEEDDHDGNGARESYISVIREMDNGMTAELVFCFVCFLKLSTERL